MYIYMYSTKIKTKMVDKTEYFKSFSAPYSITLLILFKNSQIEILAMPVIGSISQYIIKYYCFSKVLVNKVVYNIVIENLFQQTYLQVRFQATLWFSSRSYQLHYMPTTKDPCVLVIIPPKAIFPIINLYPIFFF